MTLFSNVRLLLSWLIPILALFSGDDGEANSNISVMSSTGGTGVQKRDVSKILSRMYDRCACSHMLATNWFLLAATRLWDVVVVTCERELELTKRIRKFYNKCTLSRNSNINKLFWCYQSLYSFTNEYRLENT